MLVDSQKDAVVITHLKRGEGVAAGNAGGQDIPLGAFKQLFLQCHQRQCGEQSLFFPEVAGDCLHVL